MRILGAEKENGFLNDRGRELLDGTGFIAAEVPGSVINDLLNAGAMDDPYYRDNELKALTLMKNDFEYHGTFDVDTDELADADEVIFRFDGLDTIADITLNGNKLGVTDNMHRTWEFPVKKLLNGTETPKERDTGCTGKQGAEGAKNELVIVFKSPVNYIAERFKEDPKILGTEDAMRGFPKIRKAHYMFGWDWGPRIPDAGIWKAAKLLKVKKARMTKVYVHQTFNEDYSEASIRVDVSLERPEKVCLRDSDIRVLVTVKDPDGKILVNRVDISEECDISTHGSRDGKDAANIPGRELLIKNPRLWWPNGLGEQPLYTVVTELVDGGALIDSDTKRIGLRRLEVSTGKDEYGSEFAFAVNGVKFFAMGADYIPEDNILPRTNRERTYKLLRECTAANFNCIRVWGGGTYPSDDFLDACDELGLVVWQDFMFACANYRLTPDFETSITAELRDRIAKLAHHACIGLWCGNNEMEEFAAIGGWGADDAIRKDYIKMYEDIFPCIVKEEDPDRFYWPSSPSSGGGFDDPNCPDRGDTHYWDVWHGSKPFTEYRQFFFRFLSEFGFQSFPSIRTVESFTIPEDRNVFSYVMEKHQRNASANGKIVNYMEQTFLYPNNLDLFIYASQLMQAEAIRYGVEHFRRNRGRCMGTVYWQLNDCWPVASWASIDYYGRWKALHYYAKRFFAPLMISCEEEGLLSQSMNVNAEPFEVQKSIRLNVANESRCERKAVVRWALRNAEADVLREGSEEITVAPLSAVWLEKTDLAEARLYEDYVSYELVENGEVVSEGTVLFCQPKHFRFVDPKLQVRVEGDEIVVSAKHYARSIEIRNKEDNFILSDNFFDLNGGEKRVKILEGEPEGVEVRSVWSIR
ncbi:MAG: glycoside hydrolase family 2 protein [Lachnospiraceae bacterium]|nr:glycoside hydrolase family 2 protein [Lachnospiraceae bacterium]